MILLGDRASMPNTRNSGKSKTVFKRRGIKSIAHQTKKPGLKERFSRGKVWGKTYPEGVISRFSGGWP